MNANRQALGELLKADATLDGLCSIHFEMVADLELSGPFCIYNSMSGSEAWSLQGGGQESELWLVKGVSLKAAEAEDIDNRCRELLDDSDLGGSAVFCRRVAPVAFAQMEDATIHYYRGSTYRVVTNAG